MELTACGCRGYPSATTGLKTYHGLIAAAKSLSPGRRCGAPGIRRLREGGGAARGQPHPGCDAVGGWDRRQEPLGR
jgi:hypothetical protein